jgi:hypothetical protein
MQIWLGRTWITDPVGNYAKYPTKATAVPQTIYNDIANATLHYVLNAIGLEGAGSSPEYPYFPKNTAPVGATEVEMVGPAVHCQG